MRQTSRRRAQPRRGMTSCSQSLYSRQFLLAGLPEQEVRGRFARWMCAIERQAAVDVNLVRERVYAERIAVPDHYIRILAGLERADAIIQAECLGRICRQPANRPLRRNVETGADAARHCLRGFLV